MMAPAAAASTPVRGMRPAVAVIDRCWTLPVVVACSTFLYSMPQVTSGILYVFFMEKFSVSREAALWPRTVESVTASVMGFVIGAAQQKVSIYTMIVIGALVCPVAIVTSAFVPNMAWMAVTCGFLYGASTGTLFIATSIYVVSYFKNYRGVAIGITSVGFSMSGIVGASLLPYLQYTYGVSGALVVTGGMMLNLIPLALMIRKPRPWERCLCLGSKATGHHDTQLAATNYGTAETVSTNTHRSSIGLPTNEHRDPLSNFQPQNEKTKRVIALDNRLHLAPSEVGQSAPRPPTSEIHESIDSVIIQTLRLLRVPCFYILLVSLVACDFTSQMFNATVVDYAGDKGVSRNKAAQLAACSSVGSICGQVSITLLSDKLARSRCTPAVLSFAVMSLCFFVMPCFVDFVAISIVTVVTGIQQGYLRTLKPVLVADYLGTHNVPMCWGMIGLVGLPLTLCEPSIVGVFRDTGGSYDNLYRMCGAVDLIAAFVLLVQACLDTRNTRRMKITSPHT